MEKHNLTLLTWICVVVTIFIADHVVADCGALLKSYNTTGYRGANCDGSKSGEINPACRFDIIDEKTLQARNTIFNLQSYGYRLCFGCGDTIIHGHCPKVAICVKDAKCYKRVIGRGAYTYGCCNSKCDQCAGKCEGDFCNGDSTLLSYIPTHKPTTTTTTTTTTSTIAPTTVTTTATTPSTTAATTTTKAAITTANSSTARPMTTQSTLPTISNWLTWSQWSQCIATRCPDEGVQVRSRSCPTGSCIGPFSSSRLCKPVCSQVSATPSTSITKVPTTNQVSTTTAALTLTQTNTTVIPTSTAATTRIMTPTPDATTVLISTPDATTVLTSTPVKATTSSAQLNVTTRPISVTPSTPVIIVPTRPSTPVILIPTTNPASTTSAYLTPTQANTTLIPTSASATTQILTSTPDGTTVTTSTPIVTSTSPAQLNVKTGPTECAVCLGPLQLCEQLYHTETCTAPNNFCINQIKNYASGARTVNRTCGSAYTCEFEWYLGTSDNDKCGTFDSIYTLDFSCTYCCVDDNCNIPIRPIKSSLYTPG